MENGDVTVMTELWATTAGDAMKASDATGKTENLVRSARRPRRVVVPALHKEKCPGLPDWKRS